MAVTLYRGAFKNAPRVPCFEGLSTDTKPTTDADGSVLPNGSTFCEIDTSDIYRFDAENSVWYKGFEQE